MMEFEMTRNFARDVVMHPKLTPLTIDFMNILYFRQYLTQRMLTSLNIKNLGMYQQSFYQRKPIPSTEFTGMCTFPLNTQTQDLKKED